MALTELTEAVYPEDTSEGSAFNEVTIQKLQISLYTDAAIREKVQQTAKILSAEPDLAVFLPVEGEPDPAIIYPTGWARIGFQGLIITLLISAAQRIYYLRMDQSKPSFVRIALENYEEMLRAGRGEPVRAYSVMGYTGIRLPDSAQVRTPWGMLRAVASDFRAPGRMGAQATAILSSPLLITIGISREPEPEPPPADQQWVVTTQRSRQLLPLAFALATIDGQQCAPMSVFETILIPILAINSFSVPGMSLPPQRFAEPNKDELNLAEDWSRRLDQEHEDNLQVAERRLVSAIAERADKADSLIDAVIAWESIVGTRTETVFRVTAALARLLEPDSAKRSELRRALGKIYDTRSRVVHGELVDPADIAAASDEAIRIGLRTLKELYSRSADWRAAKSGDRADRIILGD